MAALVFWVGQADAGRKRVVVLEFEGPNADKFHDDVVKLIKKSHTVVKAEKWNKAAEELDAAKVTEKNVKKVAKKLKVDGVITGKIEKRRDEYIIKLKLRAGTTGELMSNSVSTKADGPRLEGQAQRDIKDELIAVIDELESNRGGGSDEEGEDAPKGDDPPKKSGFSRKDDEEDKPKKVDEEKAALSTKREDPEEEEVVEKPKKDEGAKRRKRKASAEDEGEGESDSVEEEVEVEDEDKALNLSPSHRAIDAVVGLSFTRRNLSFTHQADLGDPPPGYKQTIPVAGALVDVTAYPMAFGHKKKGIITGIGVNVVYDQVIKINSQKRYSDDMNMPRVANLDTKESRWSFGAVFRYPIGTSAKAPVVGGSLTYGKQKFTVAQELPNNDPTDIPNVSYSMISPAVFVRFPALPKISFNLDAAFHAITNTGAIQTRTQYGAATVSGYTVVLGVDYSITPNIFARAGVRYQKIGFTFKGDPMSQTNTRDTDPEQDVTGANDSYFGGLATVGYAY